MAWRHFFSCTVKNFRPLLLGFTNIKPARSIYFGQVFLAKGMSSSKSNLDLSGIYPPIPTSFNENEDIDFEKLKSNLAKWNKMPFAGKVIHP